MLFLNQTYDTYYMYMSVHNVDLKHMARCVVRVHVGVHRVAVTWIPKVRWTFDEIPKMSPGGARTHDPAATLSKLQPNLGIQVTATRCKRCEGCYQIFHLRNLCARSCLIN